LRHNEFARYLGVDPGYLTRLRNSGRAFRDESTNRYDLAHEVNHALVVAAASTKAPEPTPEAIDDEELIDLQREKLLFERDRVREQSIKLALQNSVTKSELVPFEMVKSMFGEMSGAVKTYLLTVPNRVARGDVRIRDELEKELAEGIQRWIDASIAAFESWAREHYEITGDDNDDDDTTD